MSQPIRNEGISRGLLGLLAALLFALAGCGDDVSVKGSFFSRIPGNRIATVPVAATAQFITFPESFGAFSTDCIYQAPNDTIAPNGSPFVFEVVLRATVANFALFNEFSRKGDPDSGWTMQAYTGDTLRGRHHDAALSPEQMGGLVPMSPMGEVIHALWWFNGAVNTARSYRQGVLVAETTVTGARVADPGSLLLIPGPGGNPEVEIAHIWASGNATVLNALDTDAEVWARWVTVRDAMLAGLAPPDPASFDLHADASVAGVGTNPQNWVLSGAAGGTIATFVTAPPAVRTTRAFSFASPTFPAPTLTAPPNGLGVSSGNDVTVSASFTRDTLVTGVAWFANGVQVASDSSTPFSSTWSAPAINTYTVFARATYVDGSTQDSTSVSISVVASVPLDQIFAANLISWRESNEVSGTTNVTAWLDKVGGTAATILAAPAIVADATLGRNIVRCVAASSQGWTQPLDRPAPATEVTTVIAVLRQDSPSISGASVWGPGNNTMNLIQSSTNLLNMRGGVVGPTNSNAAIGAWKLIIAQYKGTALSSLKIGSVRVTGDCGNLDPSTPWTWSGRTNNVNFTNISWSSAAVVNRAITTGEEASVEAYYSSLGFPASVFN